MPTMELKTSKGTKLIQISNPEIESVNAIKMELETLAESIQMNKRPKVDIDDGYKALKLAHQIIREIEMRGEALGLSK